jgi:hypothetical protein
MERSHNSRTGSEQLSSIIDCEDVPKPRLREFGVNKEEKQSVDILRQFLVS